MRKFFSVLLASLVMALPFFAAGCNETGAGDQAIVLSALSTEKYMLDKAPAASFAESIQQGIERKRNKRRVQRTRQYSSDGRKIRS